MEKIRNWLTLKLFPRRADGSDNIRDVSQNRCEQQQTEKQLANYKEIFALASRPEKEKKTKLYSGHIKEARETNTRFY